MIDQALLGYDRGHRLLASSLRLPRDAEAALVALSDTDVRHGRRLTGMPLDSLDRYALIATWPAPDAGRPGAVFAHALLLHADAFQEFDVSDLAALLSAPHDSGSIPSYAEPLSARRVQRRATPPSEGDAYLCARALYASKVRHANVEDPQAAEAALLALWSAQWPALQARFSFALRSARHRPSRPLDLLVLTGEPPPPPRPHGDDAWLQPLATELAAGRGSLTSWIGTFGPEEPPRIASVRALGRIWSSMQDEQVDDVLARLAERYPTPEDHATLKLAVLGRAGPWWSATETERLTGLLGTSARAWDLAELELELRFTEESKTGRWAGLIAALSEDAPAEMRDALLAGLAAAASPEMLGALAERDLLLAGRLLAQSHLGIDPAAWRGLDNDTVTALLRSNRSDVRPRELAAALAAGHVIPVVKAAGVRATLKATGHVDAKTLTKIAKSAAAPDLLRGAEAQEVLRLAAAGADVPVVQRVTALETLREHPDARWLKLAVQTLAEDPACVDVVFGPLHAAAVASKLTQKSTKRLEAILPPGRGVPQRLRALLLARARKERWSRARLARAARGAGPEAHRLVEEAGPKDPLQKAIRRLLSRAGLDI